MRKKPKDGSPSENTTTVLGAFFGGKMRTSSTFEFVFPRGHKQKPPKAWFFFSADGSKNLVSASVQCAHCKGWAINLRRNRALPGSWRPYICTRGLVGANLRPPSFWHFCLKKTGAVNSHPQNAFIQKINAHRSHAKQTWPSPPPPDTAHKPIFCPNLHPIQNRSGGLGGGANRDAA